VLGAGFQFEDRGPAALRGVPARWRILALGRPDSHAHRSRSRAWRAASVERGTIEWIGSVSRERPCDHGARFDASSRRVWPRESSGREMHLRAQRGSAITRASEPPNVMSSMNAAARLGPPVPST
jgi:hypothetical protein